MLYIKLNFFIFLMIVDIVFPDICILEELIPNRWVVDISIEHEHDGYFVLTWVNLASQVLFFHLDILFNVFQGGVFDWIVSEEE